MIYVIYTKEQEGKARDILHFLIQEKGLVISSAGGRYDCLESDDRISQDSALVLVSDAAVRDKEWQAVVRGLSEEIRMIPIGGTEEADYSDPEIMPKRIEEINFIQEDENYYGNIWNSLTTDKEFYELKSMVLSNMNAWISSKGSDSFLLSDRKTIKQIYPKFQKRLETETNLYFQKELTAIIAYLKRSLKNAKRLWRRKAVNYAKSVVVLALALVCGRVFFTIAENFKNITYAQNAMSMGSESDILPPNAVKLVEGIRNPLVSDLAKMELYNKLSVYLNHNWYNTVIGLNYRWALNDVRLCGDERYVWSANGNGEIAKWDAYTGRILEQETVSDQPLSAIAAAKDERHFAAIDSEGYIFKKEGDGGWAKSRVSYDIPFNNGKDLVCDENMDTIAVYSEKGSIYYLDLRTDFHTIWEGTYDDVFCSEISEQGLEAVVRIEDNLYDVCVGREGSVDEIPIPVKKDEFCTLDILNGKILLADENHQLITWQKEAPKTVNTEGIVFSRPIHLCYLSENRIVYNDRDRGTHLYDLERRLDLGSILGEAVAVSDLSALQSTVLAVTTSGTCYTENVESLLPVENIADQDVCERYTAKETSSNGMIQQASIENEYLIRLELQRQGGKETQILDGGKRYFIGEAQADTSLMEEEGEEVYHYNSEPIRFTGRPMVIGILENGNTLLVGGSDGSFFEIVFTETGRVLCGSQLQIPSHAAITEIYQMKDCYYLKDATGTLWRARMGYEALTEKGAVAAVKEELHCAVSDDLLEIISPETKEALDLVRMPGGGEEQWE